MNYELISRETIIIGIKGKGEWKKKEICNLGMIAFGTYSRVSTNSFLTDVNDLTRMGLDDKKRKRLGKTLSFFSPSTVLAETSSLEINCLEANEAKITTKTRGTVRAKN